MTPARADPRDDEPLHHLPSPTPEQLAELLAACGLTAYGIGKLRLGVTPRTIQRALKGEHPLDGTQWAYMRVVLTQAARDELPEPRA